MIEKLKQLKYISLRETKDLDFNVNYQKRLLVVIIDIKQKSN